MNIDRKKLSNVAGSLAIFGIFGAYYSIPALGEDLTWLPINDAYTVLIRILFPLALGGAAVIGAIVHSMPKNSPESVTEDEHTDSTGS